MSVNYATGLSQYDNKGVCGINEIFDSSETVEKKVDTLAKWLSQSKCAVVYCGAGISTAAGIPDFRGPNGVWTLEEKGVKTEANSLSFTDAIPTYTHLALIELIRAKYLKFIVSQNIDGLFLRANLSRKYIAELHGNFFVDQCTHCPTKFIRNTPSPTMGLKVSANACTRNSRPCRGMQCDTILDWEDELPKDEMRYADKYSRSCDLAICLGTTLQIEPAASLPLITKKLSNGKLVIVNLQPTRFDNKADLVIHDYIDNVMVLLCKCLNVSVDNYDVTVDPTKSPDTGKEWKRK